MNIEVIKSAWRRMKKPHPATIEQIAAAGAKVVHPPSGRDFWPDYAPRRLQGRGDSPESPEAQQWARVTRTLTAQIGKEVA